MTQDEEIKILRKIREKAKTYVEEINRSGLLETTCMDCAFDTSTLDRLEREFDLADSELPYI